MAPSGDRAVESGGRRWVYSVISGWIGWGALVRFQGLFQTGPLHSEYDVV